MAGISKAERERRAAEAAAAQADGPTAADQQPSDAQAPAAADESPSAPEDGLIAVGKSGDVLRIHPTTLRAHVDAGWAPI